MKLLYLNARSLISKLNDLAILINDHNPDVILITETWCNGTITNAMLNVKGYSIEPDLRIDRNDTFNGIGGGILVYARNGLIVKPVEVENKFNMFVRFKMINQSKDDPDLKVTLVHRPPRSTGIHNTQLYKLFENSDENSIFVGDFNFPSINWHEYTSDRGSEPFLHCVLENGFEQLVDFPTHIRGNTLDLVLANKPENILSVEPVGNLGNSDHSILSIDLVFNSKFNITTELINDWQNGDKEGLKEYLERVDWDLELWDRGTEEAWQQIVDKVNSGFFTIYPQGQEKN